MALAELQAHLQTFYEVDLAYRIEDFLTTDNELARSLGDGHPHQPREQLLVHQTGDDLSVSLYLDAELLAGLRLHNVNALTDPDAANLADLSIALEGVSHFVYLIWNASYGRHVSLLELELQAEVDKFVTLLALLEDQGETAFARLHAWLFEEIDFAPTLDCEQRLRYVTANQFAAKYCWLVGRRYRGRGDRQVWHNELRRFYRLQHDAKLRHISTLN